MFSFSRRAAALVLAAIVAAVLGMQTSTNVAVANHAVFTVDDLGDAVDAAPGDGNCGTAGAVCTLRAAIQEANAHAGADTIVFSPALGASPFVLPASALPSITDSVLFDGSAAGGTRAVISGGGTPPGTTGLTVTGGSSTIRRVVVNRFPVTGISLVGGTNHIVEDSYIGTDHTGAGFSGNGSNGMNVGVTSRVLNNVISGNGANGIVSFGSNSLFENNTIGLNAAGTAAIPNIQSGILVSAGSGTVIGDRNVISGNRSSGISTNPGTTTTVRGNYIGTDATGTLPIGNSIIGVYSRGSFDVIGGPTSASRNIISANFGGAGVRVEGINPVVEHNYIGLDRDGLLDLGNIGNGVVVFAKDTAVLRNTIAGNDGAGIQIVTSAAIVRGNMIGTDVTGGNAMPNALGIDVASGGGTLIGGAGIGEGNLISGNTQYGVFLRAPSVTNTIIKGNLIGVDGSGLGALGNGGAGVFIVQGAANNEISDGTAPNVIAYNAVGVQLLDGAAGAGTGNKISGNSIHSNTGLGIDLAGAGVTANDAGDGDAGPNNTQNYPVLTSAQLSGGNLAVTGTLNSLPSSTFTIDVYASPTCDPSGNGEGELYQGSGGVLTDGAGNTSLSLSFPSAMPAGYVVTATATKSSGGSDTSEFSRCLTIVACPVGDLDCDGFTDVAPPTHAGPANTNTAFDNCIGIANADQANTDGNYIQLNPPKSYNDLTWANSDGLGDACDDDDDNDGIKDSDELSGATCGGIVTNPLLRDTDGDRMLDGAECALATNPTVINAAPAVCAMGPNADADGILDGLELCYYGTSSSSGDSDGDGCSDGREIMSINGDLTVNVIDLQQVSTEFGAYASPGSAVKIDFDVTKNGAINVVDLQQVSTQFGPC